jgi:hypothetical protein
MSLLGSGGRSVEPVPRVDAEASDSDRCSSSSSCSSNASDRSISRACAAFFLPNDDALPGLPHGDDEKDGAGGCSAWAAAMVFGDRGGTGGGLYGLSGSGGLAEMRCLRATEN